MEKRFEIILTEEQNNLLKKRSKELGFSHKSEYIRFILLMDNSIVDKINAIYERMVEE